MSKMFFVGKDDDVHSIVKRTANFGAVPIYVRRDGDEVFWGSCVVALVLLNFVLGLPQIRLFLFFWSRWRRVNDIVGGLLKNASFELFTSPSCAWRLP